LWIKNRVPQLTPVSYDNHRELETELKVFFAENSEKTANLAGNPKVFAKSNDKEVRT